MIQQTTQQLRAPPLPKSHPSPSVLAKLHLNVVEKAESAISLCKTASKRSFVAVDEVVDIHDVGLDERGKKERSSRIGVLKGLKGKLGGVGSGSAPDSISSSSALATDEVASGLLKHLKRTSTLNRSKAYRWLAIDAGESREQYGEAIVFLRLASSTLDQLDEASKLRNSVKSSKGEGTRRFWRGGRESERKEIEHWLASYQRLNDTVFFRPLPPVSAMLAKVPAGRSALTIKPFGLPTPAFGPGSTDFMSDGMRRLDLREHELDKESSSTKSGKDTSQGYAGAGAYY